jgi:transcriptional regulator with XRE-family HTH domain
MKEELKKEIGMRMRKIRKALGYTQEKMVSNFNIGRANYSRIEKGEVLPNASVLNTLRTKFNVSLDWLIANCGKMFVKERDKKKQEEIIHLNQYGNEIRELLLLMDKAPMVKHAMLGFFLEYKARYRDIIQEALAEAPPEPEKSDDDDSDDDTVD